MKHHQKIFVQFFGFLNFLVKLERINSDLKDTIPDLLSRMTALVVWEPASSRPKIGFDQSDLAILQIYDQDMNRKGWMEFLAVKFSKMRHSSSHIAGLEVFKESDRCSTLLSSE